MRRHSKVVVRSLSGEVKQKLDMKTSNENICDVWTIKNNRYNAYMNRYYRMYNLG